MKKKIHVAYYALLRDERGLGEERLETAAATADELYRELRERHNFSLPAARLRLAVNEEFAAWEAPLRDGDRLVFIPPVAGG